MDTKQVVEKNGGQGRNRTADTRIFSIRLRLSTEFSIDLNALTNYRIWPPPTSMHILNLSFLLCIFLGLFTPKLHIEFAMKHHQHTGLMGLATTR